MASGEFGDQGRQVDRRKIHRQRDAQHAARLRKHLAELLMGEPRLVDDALAALEIELTGLGQFDPAGRAMQEAQPDRLLQAADPSGQGRVRHADRLGRATEAPRLHDLDEHRHVVQQFHGNCSTSGSIISVFVSLSHAERNPSTPHH